MDAHRRIGSAASKLVVRCSGAYSNGVESKAGITSIDGDEVTSPCIAEYCAIDGRSMC